MLTELRLPTIKRLWAELAGQSNREGWPAERLLHTLLGYEMTERETRRLARARFDSQLPTGKSLAQFDFATVPAVSEAHVMALAEADSRITYGCLLASFYLRVATSCRGGAGMPRWYSSLPPFAYDGSWPIAAGGQCRLRGRPSGLL